MHEVEFIDEREIRKIRSYQAKALFHIAKNGIEPGDINTISSSVNESSHLANKYGILAQALYAGFVDRTPSKYRELTEKDNVLSGFHAVTRIISYAPEAYVKHCDEEDKPPRVSELAKILHRSQDLPLLFAKIQDRTNKTYESNFGLRGQPNFDIPPFVIETSVADGRAYMKPDQWILEYTEDTVAARIVQGDLANQTPERTCPATNILTKIWDVAVDICAHDDSMFAADLTQLTAETQSVSLG